MNQLLEVDQFLNCSELKQIGSLSLTIIRQHGFFSFVYFILILCLSLYGGQDLLSLSQECIFSFFVHLFSHFELPFKFDVFSQFSSSNVLIMLGNNFSSFAFNH